MYDNNEREFLPRLNYTSQQSALEAVINGAQLSMDIRRTSRKKVLSNNAANEYFWSAE